MKTYFCLKLPIAISRNIVPGHVDIVRLLIEKNANVNAEDIYKGTPIHKAALKGK